MKPKMRPLLRLYLDGTAGIVYVVDSTDTMTLDWVKDDLQIFASEELLKDVAVLIYWNRMDSPDHMSLQDGIQALDLHVVLRNHRWYIQPCSAVRDEGPLQHGFQWLHNVGIRDAAK
eukprot:PhF_6_TR37620/c1_g1_i2/m.55926/K07937/ARF1; ADP-ribosylation factor 1